MSDPYGKVKGGRLTFKWGVLASCTQSIDKKHKKKKKKKRQNKLSQEGEEETKFSSKEAVVDGEDKDKDKADGGEMYYTIYATKHMKYDELFPVEAKKFGYDPKNSATSNSSNSNSVSIEKALDDRVKKKADRYCK